MGIYSQIKEQVSTRAVAEHYGYKVNRNGMMCCPFHNDKHPSMKVDKRFHCFGCGADGDVIDFTAKLFGLSSYDAAEKLITDLGLDISGDQNYHAKPHSPVRRQIRKIRREQSMDKQFEQAVERIYSVYNDYYYLLNKLANAYAPRSPNEDSNPLFVEAMHQRDYVEYLLNLLLSGSMEDKAQIMIKKGKEVNELERRINEFKSRDRERTARGPFNTHSGYDGERDPGSSGND